MGVGIKFPGMADRIRLRLRALGYWKNDRPDVTRFGVEKGYPPGYLYPWLKDSTPTFENLQRLVKDLDVPLAWLLLGEEGGPAPAAPAAAGAKPQNSSRIHAKARRAAAPRARGLRGPLPVVAELDGIASYQTLRRARKAPGREISGGVLVLVSPPGLRRAA
jgi:hypothetical protein